MINSSESGKPRLGSRIVSLVDDDVVFLYALADLFESAGYQTRMFNAAEDFLNSGAAQFTDVLVTDIQMSGLDGLALMDRVTKVAHVPVIVITGRPERELRLRATSKGCVAFLRKPFDPVSLLCHVEAAIRQA